MEFSRCAPAPKVRPNREAAPGAVSQNSAVTNPDSRASKRPHGLRLDIASDVERRGRRTSRRARIRTESLRLLESTNGSNSRSSINGRAPTGVIAPVFPRKEVIQPQLPLRLPCYDFTPVTNPTFGGSLPCGLGHRLRVLPASVV